MVPTKSSEDFIVRYTNKDLMDKLDKIEGKLVGSIQLSKKAMWAGGTAISLSLLILSLLLSHIGKP